MVTPRRQAVSTVGFIDSYCEHYNSVFEDVRHFEAFKLLHLGILSQIPRKSLPEIAKIVGCQDGQTLHHFLKDALWDVKKIRDLRLYLTKMLIGEREIILCIDETGDAKRGKATDYVSHQYIGNLGKTKNGIVSVNAYGVVDGITYPLMFHIFKPKKCLKPEDNYRSKPQIAIEIIQKLTQSGDESWYIMTNLPIDLSLNVAQLYTLRNWIEYGFKQVKNELGWADFRMTDYSSIERWWEIIFSVYLLVSIQATYVEFLSRSEGCLPRDGGHPSQSKPTSTSGSFRGKNSNVSGHEQHPNWAEGTTWKSALNNLRLIIQPYICYCLIQPWLTVIKIPGMKRCFRKLMEFMNDFRAAPVRLTMAS